MGSLQRKIDAKLEEAWRNYKPYIKQDEDIKSLCKICECWNGEEHDYNELFC